MIDEIGIHDGMFALGLITVATPLSRFPRGDNEVGRYLFFERFTGRHLERSVWWWHPNPIIKPHQLFKRLD
jgi:hypothetical protein